MPHIRRVFLLAMSYAASGAVLSLLALTALNHLLGRPGVMRFDRGMQFAVHVHAAPRLTGVMLALTWMGAIKIFAPALCLAVIFLLKQGQRHAAALLGVSMAGALLLNESLKLHFHRARPTVAWAIGDEHTFSFPSGHSLFSVVLYGLLAYLAMQDATAVRRRLEILLPAALLPLGIGLSRIYLGMHYPTDVLAGYLTGAIWLVTVIGMDQAWRRENSR